MLAPTLAAILSAATVLDSLAGDMGVAVHFFHALPGELDAVRKSGNRWVRREMNWRDIERERGIYRFESWDRVVDSLDRHEIRAMFILGYGNSLYDSGQAPHSREGVEAFANWAASAASRYRNRGIIWEIWNEPNRDFWKPKPDLDRYIHLVEAVSRKVRSVDSSAVLLGPSEAGMNPAYLDSCVKRGLLDLVDGYTFHPYRWVAPESIESELEGYRDVLAASGHGRGFPLVVSEWGYTTGDSFVSEVVQARSLVRMRLLAKEHGLPILFWYDWRDNGADLRDRENAFGMVRVDERFDGRARPKAVFTAQRIVGAVLEDSRVDTVIHRDGGIRIIGLSRGKSRSFAVWRTARDSLWTEVATGRGRWRCVDMMGLRCRESRMGRGVISVKAGPEPTYLVQEGHDAEPHSR